MLSSNPDRHILEVLDVCLRKNLIKNPSDIKAVLKKREAPNALPLSSVSGWTTVAMTAVYWETEETTGAAASQTERASHREGGWEWFGE